MPTAAGGWPSLISRTSGSDRVTGHRVAARNRSQQTCPCVERTRGGFLLAWPEGPVSGREPPPPRPPAPPPFPASLVSAELQRQRLRVCTFSHHDLLETPGPLPTLPVNEAPPTTLGELPTCFPRQRRGHIAIPPCACAVIMHGERTRASHWTAVACWKDGQAPGDTSNSTAAHGKYARIHGARAGGGKGPTKTRVAGRRRLLSKVPASPQRASMTVLAVISSARRRVREEQPRQPAQENSVSRYVPTYRRTDARRPPKSWPREGAGQEEAGGRRHVARTW